MAAIQKRKKKNFIKHICAFNVSHIYKADINNPTFIKRFFSIY